MPDNVFRSGVAHTVVTNEITKNAINPRNNFVTTDKKSLNDISDEFAQTPTDPEHDAKPEAPNPIIQDRYDTHESLSESKTQIKRNRQKLQHEALTDSHVFLESLHKVEERIEHLRAQHPTQNRQSLERHGITDNIQSLNKKSYSDNRQLVPEKVIGNNFQSVGTGRSTRDRILYKEKKNIKENLQHLSETSAHRASASLSAPTPPDNHSNPLDLAAINLQEMSVDDMSVLLDEAMNTFNEDELRARIRKMKEKLATANQTLKNIEANDIEGSSQEP